MSDKTRQALEHISALLNKSPAPALPEELASDDLLKSLHEQLISIREILHAFSKGDLSPEIHTRGMLAGAIKALQANLRHMTWQVLQVEQGDFSQRVAFLGEFSTAFNKMVVQLDETVQSLRRKEEALTALTEDLRNEVNLRSSAMKALQESEARFKYLASHDPLTGALNRRSFMDKALFELKAAQIRVEPCSIALLDLDYFKAFNDTYGHLAGDSALKHVVKISSEALRQADIMGRYGGEEFIFLFVNADLKQGARVCERIRQAIAAKPLRCSTGNPRFLSASLGVTSVLPEQYPSYDEDVLRDIINVADMALYKAKESGRGRVVSSLELDTPVAV